MINTTPFACHRVYDFLSGRVTEHAFRLHHVAGDCESVNTLIHWPLYCEHHGNPLLGQALPIVPSDLQLSQQMRSVLGVVRIKVNL